MFISHKPLIIFLNANFSFKIWILVFSYGFSIFFVCIIYGGFEHNFRQLTRFSFYNLQHVYLLGMQSIAELLIGKSQFAPTD